MKNNMKRFNCIFTLGALMLLTSLVAVSCIDGNDWDIDTSAAHLFRVTAKSISVTPASMTASITWNATPEAEYYIIEVSKNPLTDDIEMGTGDNLVFGQDKSIKSSPYIMSGLQTETEYYLRIKAFGNGKESYWSYPTDTNFTTTDEQILNEITDEDISGESIHLTWDAAGLPVTHLTYQKEGETETTRRNLTSDEIALSAATIKGLELGTSYVIYLYNEDKLRGLTSSPVTTEQIMNTILDEDCESESIRVTWNANGKAVNRLTYLKDGDTEATNRVLSQDEIDNGIALIEGLRPYTNYTIRIYNGDVLRGETKGMTKLGAQVESAIKEGTLTSNSVTIVWDAEEIGTITGYILYVGNEVPEIPSETETALENTGILELSGLESNTTYTLAIYFDGIIRSTCTFTTSRGIPAGYTIVKVTDLNSWRKALTEQSGNVAIIIPSGSDINITGTTNGLEIPQNISSLLVWGGDYETQNYDEYKEDEKPKLGSYGFHFTGDKTDIQFYNLNVYSNNNYIINQVGNSIIETMTFESCNITTAAGVFCVRRTTAAGGSCSSISFKDCNISNIGNYSVIYTHIDGDTGIYTTNNVSFINSTINTVTGNLFRIMQSDSFILNINHCTLYNCTQSWLRSSASSADITISNTLIGKVNTSTNPNNTLGNAINGNNKDNVFTAADQECYNVGWATKTTYASDQLFSSPSAGDFKVLVSEYANYGDPRWQVQE